MRVEDRLKDVLEQRDMKPREFQDQLQRYEEFRDQMERAGVVPNKQEFSIPLMERIGNSTFKNTQNA